MSDWSIAKTTYLHMPLEEKRDVYKCGENFKTINDILDWNTYANTDDAKEKGVLAVESTNYEKDENLNKKISLFTGDITCLEVDAIVNAANAALAGGGGVDGAIHSAADRSLLQGECETLDGCDTGNAKITGGYKLPAKYVIHAVGPIGEDSELLSDCYKNALNLLKENELDTIAFPCISTGIYGYPNENAAEVALKTIREWLEKEDYRENVKRIIFCLFLDIDIEVYHKLLPEYFPIEKL